LRARADQAARALEKMAGENVALRKQCQQLEKTKAEIESEQSKKVIESLHELRVKEAKLK